MHFSRVLPLATFYFLSLSTATPVSSKSETNAIALRRDIASGPPVLIGPGGGSDVDPTGPAKIKRQGYNYLEADGGAIDPTQSKRKTRRQDISNTDTGVADDSNINGDAPSSSSNDNTNLRRHPQTQDDGAWVDNPYANGMKIRRHPQTQDDGAWVDDPYANGMKIRRQYQGDLAGERNDAIAPQSGPPGNNVGYKKVRRQA